MVGFGPSDWIELALAASLVSLVLLRPWLEPAFRALAERQVWCMLLLAVLPIALRLALLAHHPVPAPQIYDEFAHLLEADTLRHFRLANPPHPLHQFFETLFVLQAPTYSSIYPVGQGMSLAMGRLLFGVAWAGVLLSTAAFCSLSYWMLRGWVSPAVALFGGLLAVIEFGPLNQWMNSYWGGSLTATAGCLVFGALPRLWTNARVRDGLLLGIGLAIHLLTRPYESVFLLLSVLLFWPRDWRPLLKPALAAAVCVLLAGGIILLQNRSVTGQWTTLPYQLSQYQYGVPAALTFLPNPVPHHQLNPQQQMDYKMQLSFRSGSFLPRLAYRVRFYRFYFLVPLYIALTAFLFRVRTYRYAWVVLTVVLFALGTNFFPAFQFHYIAAIVCLFLLMSVVGLQRLRAAPFLAGLCVFHFAFWYGVHLADAAEPRSFETWDGINHAGPDRRTLVQEELAQSPGRQLVFVRYWPGHIFQDEWVYNEADIDRARIVWARDLGAENETLRRYYRDRGVWLLEPDARPPKLSPYAAEPPAPITPATAVEAPPEKPKPKPLQPKLRFEDVK
jgi:hypothetical protein